MAQAGAQVGDIVDTPPLVRAGELVTVDADQKGLVLEVVIGVVRGESGDAVFGGVWWVSLRSTHTTRGALFTGWRGFYSW